MQSGDGWPAAEAGVALVVMAAERIGVQVPRLRSVPAYESSKGEEAIEVARSVGLLLDPFQELVLVDACGCRSDGKWAAFEVATEMPRQNGKGGILEARELAGILAWGERLIIHSAHEFQTATEAMLRMEDLLSSTPEVSKLVKSVSRSHGSEGFIFTTGQRLRYRTRTKGGGRGFTARDTLILDEAMVLQSPFIGALVPTLSARSIAGNPQVWYAGSAVDQLVHEHGLVLARLRARALAGADPSLAYFGWSALDAVDDDGKPITPDHDLVAAILSDPDAWAAANPAFGIRISEGHIEKELPSLGRRNFAVERLGIGDWPNVDADEGAVIDGEAWDALADADSEIVDPAVAFAFEVSPDRSWSVIGAAGGRADGLTHVEVVDRHPGTGWVVSRLLELVERHETVGVFCGGASAAASLVPELERGGVAVTVATSSDLAQASGMFFDSVEQERIRHLGTSDLAAAVRGARKRELGDAWAWSWRKSTTNIAPLVAVTLALWGAQTGSTVAPWAESW